MPQRSVSSFEIMFQMCSITCNCNLKGFLNSAARHACVSVVALTELSAEELNRV